MAELPDYDKIAFDLISKWYQSGKKPPLIELQKDIAAALRTADAEARKQEREECAKDAEDFRAGEDVNAQTESGFWGRRIAAAIRARHP